jgi:hypothetical protein
VPLDVPGRRRSERARQAAGDRQGPGAPARLLLVSDAGPLHRRGLAEDPVRRLGPRHARPHRRSAGAIHDPAAPGRRGSGRELVPRSGARTSSSS